jgi:hypothetical protein
LCMLATLFGMALGGWLSGVIFDLTGSYRAVFANGLTWNILNGAIVIWLLTSARGWNTRSFGVMPTLRGH